MKKSQASNHESRNWYVVQTKPMSEERVCRQFAKGSLHMNERGVASGQNFAVHGSQLTDHGIEAFCPKIKSVTSGRKDVAGAKYRPLFPSYIFLRWDLSSSTNHRLVKYTRGVNRVLGDGEKAVPISSEIVEMIRSRIGEGGLIEQKTFKAGDQIKVRKGHLKDLLGILERPVSDSGRVAVLLNLFNRQMRVQMHCSEIGLA